MNENPNNNIEQAENELTPEELEEVESLFPNGEPQTEEEKLLYNKAVMELATSPEGDSVDLKKIKEDFEKERSEIKSKGGYDPKDYIINTGNQPGAGTVEILENKPGE